MVPYLVNDIHLCSLTLLSMSSLHKYGLKFSQIALIWLHMLLHGEVYFHQIGTRIIMQVLRVNFLLFCLVNSGLNAL